MNRVEAAAKALVESAAGNVLPYNAATAPRWKPRAVAALAAADDVMFSPASIAEIVRTTGLSIQTVSEVVRALKGAGE